MTRVILFGNEYSLSAWLGQHGHEFAGWKKKDGVFDHPNGDRVMLIACSTPSCVERLRGFTINDLEVHGPYHEHLHRAAEWARGAVHSIGEMR